MDFSPTCSTLFLSSKTYAASCFGNLIVKSQSLLGHLLTVQSVHMQVCIWRLWKVLTGCRQWRSPRPPSLCKINDLLFCYSHSIGKIGVGFKPPLRWKCCFLPHMRSEKRLLYIGGDRTLYVNSVKFPSPIISVSSGLGTPNYFNSLWGQYTNSLRYSWCTILYIFQMYKVMIHNFKIVIIK